MVSITMYWICYCYSCSFLLGPVPLFNQLVNNMSCRPENNRNPEMFPYNSDLISSQMDGEQRCQQS
jgi:hypothetical protein